MLKSIRHPRREAAGAFVTIGQLVSMAFEEHEDVVKRASEVLRGTYLTEKYLPVWPNTILHKSPRAEGGGAKPKNWDFTFRADAKACCFVRNLWALDQFFSRPSHVLDFLMKEPNRRLKLFGERCEELQVLAQVYRRWPAERERVEKLIPNFNPLQTDLYALITAPEAATPIKVETVVVEVSASVADQIRRLEQRPSYRVGDPFSLIEKALCYLELGCKEISQRIATQALKEHPEHPAVLYGNAVLLLLARKGNLSQAFHHELMHPADLEPVTSEEHFHHDRQMAEVGEAMQRESDAFELLVRALEKWPIDLPFYTSAMHPVSWRVQAERTVLQIGAGKLLNPFHREERGIDGKPNLSESLRACVCEVVKELPRLLFLETDLKPLLHLLIITSRTETEAGHRCLDWIQAELAAVKGIQKRSKRLTSAEAITLGHATIAESMANLLTEEPFVDALVRLIGAKQALKLCQLIESCGTKARQQRIIHGHVKALTELVRDSAHRPELLEESLAACVRMEREPHLQIQTTPSPKRKHWRYAIIRLLLESSWAAFNAKNATKAVSTVSDALKWTLTWFSDVAGKAPMVTFVSSSDDYEDAEFQGDWLRAEPNIITGRDIIIRLPAVGDERFPRYFSKWTPAKPPEEFAKWAAVHRLQATPLLLTYADWLVELVPQANRLKPQLRKVRRRIAKQ